MQKLALCNVIIKSRLLHFSYLQFTILVKKTFLPFYSFHVFTFFDVFLIFVNVFILKNVH